MTELPEKFIAGDTVSWTTTASGYPASAGWTLKYKISGDTQTTVTGTRNNDGWDCTITAADSAKIVPGIYEYVKWVEKTVDSVLERHTVRLDRIEVEENLALANEPQDRRTTDQQTLDNLNEILKAFAANPKYEFTYNGRTYRQADLPDLLAWQSRLETRIKNAKDADAMANGGTRKKILVNLGATS